MPQYRPVGAGWGTFPDVYAATQSSVPDAAVLVGNSREPHNVWFLAAIELGVPGLLLLALVFVLTFVDAVRLPPSLRGPPVAAFVATIFAALFLSNLEFKFFWMAIILVSLARSLSLQVDRSEPIRRPTPVERVRRRSWSRPASWLAAGWIQTKPSPNGTACRQRGHDDREHRQDRHRQQGRRPGLAADHHVEHALVERAEGQQPGDGLQPFVPRRAGRTTR